MLGTNRAKAAHDELAADTTSCRQRKGIALEDRSGVICPAEKSRRSSLPAERHALNLAIHRDKAEVYTCKSRFDVEVSMETWMDNAMSPTSQYCWVVVCKNHRFHRRQSVYGHRIPLGQTDAISPRPALYDRLRIRCDNCSKEYSYEPAEVLRIELELPESFVPHPLFSAD